MKTVFFAVALLLAVASTATASLSEDQSLIMDTFHRSVNEFAHAEWKEEYLSLVEVSSTVSEESGEGGGGSESELVGACEVCVFVIENKEQHQPYLCRGLKDPNYQKACVEVMESLMWWLTNEVYWLNYGCAKENNGATEWVRPCPAHAVCSWIESLYTRTPFCPADPYYKKPQ